MKFELWAIGKTSFKYLSEGEAIYEKRLSHYLNFKTEIFPDVKNPKNLKPSQLTDKEGVMVLKKIKNEDFLILLDERGKQFSSVEFSKKIENWQMNGSRRIVFLIGGAFGFSKEVSQRANQKNFVIQNDFFPPNDSPFLLEQLYRGMTILRGEPYHNE